MVKGEGTLFTMARVTHSLVKNNWGGEGIEKSLWYNIMYIVIAIIIVQVL